MEELLEEWSQIEPQRCRVHFHTGLLYAETLYARNDRADTPRREEDWWIFRANEESQNKADEAMLLFSIIEAINSHGWGWHVACENQQGMTHYAFIVKDDPNYFDKLQLGNTPAEALLKAYLRALNQENEEEV